MTQLSILSAASVALAMLGAPVLAQDDPVTVDTVVATVNGTDITVGHLALARAALPDQYKQLPPEVLFDGLREQLVQQTVLVHALEAVPRRLEFLMENEERELKAGEALSAIVKAGVTEEALQAAYDAQFANATPGQEYNASHILVETEDEANALIARLDDGADFSKLARENSTGPSGPNGGQLGWFTTGQMVKPFEDAVVALEVGAISSPVQTQFGWHVITLNEKRDQAIPPLDEVRADLSAQVERTVAEGAVSGLMEAAEVTLTEGLDPAVLVDESLFSFD